MLATLTADHFAPHVGSEFLYHAPDGNRYALTLTEATALNTPGVKAPAALRPPFSLLFLGPPEPILPQAIYPLEHAAMETLPIFIVPVGRTAEGIQYQAVFN